MNVIYAKANDGVVFVKLPLEVVEDINDASKFTDNDTTSYYLNLARTKLNYNFCAQQVPNILFKHQVDTIVDRLLTPQEMNTLYG